MKKEKRKTGKVWYRTIEILACIIAFAMAWMMTFGTGDMGNLYKMYGDLPTLLLIVVSALLVLVFAGIEKDFFGGFRLAFTRRKGISRMELQRALNAFRYVERTVVLTAVIAMVFPLTDIFYHLDGINIWALGPVLGVLNLTILYSAVLLLILTPVKIRLERRIISYMEEPEDEEAERKEADGQRLYFGLRSLGLTDREAEVARLAASGMTNAQIGQELYISMATVKKHMTHVLEKTQCGDREALTEKIRGM
nr:helix-turn-helix transcriptional regulator [uncultured Acetatifactor sp.]